MITSWPREIRSVPSVSGESIACPPGLSVIESTSTRGSAASSRATSSTRRLLSAVISPRLVTSSAATTNAPGCANRSRRGIVGSFPVSVCLTYHRRMAALHVLDAETARMVEGVCDAIVPGSARVRPAVYVDALLARMEDGPRAAALAAFASLADGAIDRARRDARVPPGAGARDRGVLQRLRRARRRRDRRLGGDRLQHSSRDAPGEGLVLPRASDERALRRRGRRLRRGWRSRGRRARGSRPERAPAGAAARTGPRPTSRAGRRRRRTISGGRSVSR